MGFSRQEYWSGLPFPSPGDLPDTGIKPAFATLQADSSPLGHLGSPEYMRAGGIHALHRPAMGTCQLWPGYTEMSIPRGHSSQLCHLTWQLFNIKSLGWSEIEYSDDTH